MSEVSSRLFDNDYFRSIDALFALATYRLSILLEALPFLLVFLTVALFHGVEPREFALYRPLQNFEGDTLLVGTA
jgi:hypothetical protein